MKAHPVGSSCSRSTWPQILREREVPSRAPANEPLGHPLNFAAMSLEMIDQFSVRNVSEMVTELASGHAEVPSLAVHDDWEYDRTEIKRIARLYGERNLYVHEVLQ